MSNLLANAPLNFPQARDWMWDYCIYLGPWRDSNNRAYDLGIHLDNDGRPSAAVVDDNEPGSYYSGDFEHMYRREIYQETWRRAKELCLVTKEYADYIDARNIYEEMQENLALNQSCIADCIGDVVPKEIHEMIDKSYADKAEIDAFESVVGEAYRTWQESLEQ
ncbi:hypothetical protein PP178_04230 [Zeaxanthinibacter sp. PT1]|uniref:hypothetical protein n=1 Tax=Zeaxanthinibacter TaxID=561554 RepID=UPI002349F633|nr:hypothetical protein [Zeaxanthinibacter sp. PT1]MDC6350747.1 hypothetical protein [Zeaxanthinibacter sp. PT1]